MSNRQPDQKSNARADFAGAVFLILFVLMQLGFLDSMLLRIMVGPEETNPLLRAGNELFGLNELPAKMRAENWFGFACFAATVSFLIACTTYGVLSVVRGIFLWPASVASDTSEQLECAQESQDALIEDKSAAPT